MVSLAYWDWKAVIATCASIGQAQIRVLMDMGIISIAVNKVLMLARLN